MTRFIHHAFAGPLRRTVPAIFSPDRCGERSLPFFSRTVAEIGEDQEIIRSTVVPGLLLRREWLDPEKLPDVAGCLQDIEVAE